MGAQQTSLAVQRFIHRTVDCYGYSWSQYSSLVMPYVRCGGMVDWWCRVGHVIGGLGLKSGSGRRRLIRHTSATIKDLHGEAILAKDHCSILTFTPHCKLMMIIRSSALHLSLYERVSNRQLKNSTCMDVVRKTNKETYTVTSRPIEFYFYNFISTTATQCCRLVSVGLSVNYPTLLIG
jgi:hypothetical protein